MAKKVKKVVKKSTSVRKAPRKHHHRWEHHDFLIVVAGGFIVIAIIFLLSDSFRGQISLYTNRGQQASEAQMFEDNQNEKVITIKEFAYSHDTLVIKKGTTVTWTNEDAETHSATADDGSFNTGSLAQGESGSVTFNDVGKHSYHCSVHPNMTGTIVVEE